MDVSALRFIVSLWLGAGVRAMASEALKDGGRG